MFQQRFAGCGTRRAQATVPKACFTLYRKPPSPSRASCWAEGTEALIKGGGGEFERHPSKDIAFVRSREGAHIQQAAAPGSWTTHAAMHEAGDTIDLACPWHGAGGQSLWPWPRLGTGRATLRLWTLKSGPDT